MRVDCGFFENFISPWDDYKNSCNRCSYPLHSAHLGRLGDER